MNNRCLRALGHDQFTVPIGMLGSKLKMLQKVLLDQVYVAKWFLTKVAGDFVLLVCVEIFRFVESHLTEWAGALLVFVHDFDMPSKRARRRKYLVTIVTLFLGWEVFN